MAGPMGLLLMLSLFSITGVLAIQNEKTSLDSAREKLVLSASAFSEREKTVDDFVQDGPSSLQRTLPSLHLESTENGEKLSTDHLHASFKSSLLEEPMDLLTASKHVYPIEENNIEMKSGDYYRSIAPTRSEQLSGEDQGAPQNRNLLSEPQKQPVGRYNQRQRSLSELHMQPSFQQRQNRQEMPRIYSEHAPPPVLQTSLPGQGKRQANPDIQDIITGIVKLLNGNVNVAANTARPLRPIQATRINNRGPPRISDGPLLPPDFDTPGMNPPPLPDHPYPFEKPPAIERPSVNQLRPERPHNPQGNRPGYENPWNRPQRPSVTRRPIPPYKPLPPQSHDHPGFEKRPDKVEKPHFELKPGNVSVTEGSSYYFEPKPNATLHPSTERPTIPNVISESTDSTSTSSGQQQSEAKPHAKPLPRPNYDTTSKKPQKYQPPMKDGVANPENTLVLGSKPLSYPIPNSDNDATSPKKSTTTDSQMSTSSMSELPLHEEIKPSKTMKIEKTEEPLESSIIADEVQKASVIPVTSNTTSKTMYEKTLAIETSSSVQLVEPTPTITEIQPTVIPLPSSEHKSSTVDFPILESSNVETTDFKVDAATPTESLPSLVQSSTSVVEESSTLVPTTSPKTPVSTDYYPYRPRPGIVLDDTLDYTGIPGLATHRPYSPPRYPQIGDIFDVTVSAIQGPGGGGSGDSVHVSLKPGTGDVIVTSAVEGQGFVSIDGKRTYLNLFDNTDSNLEPTSLHPQPTRTQSPVITGTGYAVAQPDPPTITPRPSNPIRRPTYHRRPAQPPVRIDTCIVGDSSTCDGSQHEACATVQGVSACHCKPGYARLQHSLPCKRTVSIVVSMRVDKVYDRKVIWDAELADKDSDSYATLAYEANRAIESAMSMTPFSDEYMGSSVNSIYHGDVSQGQGGVFVNTTLKLTYEPRTSRTSLAGELQKHLLGVIHRRNNNIGNSALYVDSPAGSVSNLQDLDECASSELNDCHSSATCTNTWGGFTCACQQGFKDPHKNDPIEAGRNCLSCTATHCNNRGLCSYQGDEMQCTCTGNYYGSQCEIDGEVLGVAIGASVAALIIIVLTLVCLVMWSRRWSREQKTVGSPVYGYMQGGGMPGTLPGTLARVGSVGTLASGKQGPPTGLPPYMWAHIADHMATANVYAAEPMGSTRPSSAMFGYPTLSMHGTLPPVPLPRLQAPPRPRHRHQPEPDSSDSELQDRDRADLIPQNGGFHVPRPKSRSSVANQSGIYYDVEYDQGDSHHLSKNNIPMSTYSMARPYYRT